METKKKLGIWMDHSIAYLMEFTTSAFEIKTIESEFHKQKKIQTSSKSDSLMRNKEQQKLFSYYKKISEIIKDYKKVILFGPSNAKVELFDFLSEDERFIKIKFEIKNTDNMTKEQKNSFVMDMFFSKRPLKA
jgi:stalled ribosome rescue protein Dom34